MRSPKGALQHPEHAGTRCAFGDAVEPHLIRMYETARRILPTDDLAWDAVQTTLIRLWRGHGVPQHACGVLVSVVRSVSLEILRGNRRRVHHECAAAGTAGATCDVDPAAHVELEELRARIGDALQALPADCRDAVLLRTGADLDGDGLDYEGIAAQLGVPIGTVRSRLHRARHLLEQRLGELVPA